MNGILRKELWNRLDLFFNDCFHLPHFLPKTAFFGFFNTYSNNLILVNHILLLFLKFIKQQTFALRKLIRIITKVKDIEKESAGNGNTKLCSTTKNSNILKICYFMLVSVMIQMGEGGWGRGVDFFVLCFVFLLISNMIFFLFPLY